MLKSIYIVTLLVLSAGHSERVYQDNFAYETVEKGQVPAVLASSWQAPAAEGRPYVVMQPESGEDVYLRFIEAAHSGNYAPMKTVGWNAVELQVRDPDRLVADLDPDAFEPIGPPAFLTGTENIRAAQALGPAAELLYLTHVIDPSRASFNIGTAASWVDRVFIMVLGTADVGATASFYQDWFDQEVSGPWPYRVTVLSRAWGMPEDTVYDLSIAQLQEPFLIEIDQHPSGAQRRTPTDTGLPFGPAIVTFRVASPDRLERRTGRASVRPGGFSYRGLEALTVEGPSGELIELVAPLEASP